MAKKNRSKLSEWQDRAKRGGTCQKCKLHSDYLTIDHIVPVSILDMLDETGEAKYENESNFQFLCRPCNALKGCRLDKRNPITKQILIELFR